MSDNIYKRVANHVTGLFEKHPNPNLVFHNLAHTRNVVERAQEIAAHYQFSESDTLTIYVAAWFHDIGHLFTDIEKHEEKGVEMMREYMQKDPASNELLITNIAGCILATKVPNQPKTPLEEVLCDADTYHFGTKEFKVTNKQVKKEFALRGYDILLHDWENNTIEMLEKHVFFTSYCKILLEERKRKNILWLKRKKEKVITDNTHHSLFVTGSDKDKNKKEGETLLARGLQTMLRLTSANHFHLSEMADRKANILISVNSIIIGVILSLLVDKLSDAAYLTIPVIIFLVSCLTTIIIAILSTRPKITEGIFSKEDILSKKTNLLFFGNFYRSSLEEYQWAMSTLMKDNEYLYSSIVKDIYQIGVVLGRKYKLIRLAYNVFMVGLIVSVFAFFIAALLNYGHTQNVTTITNASGSPL
jgi:predicted metal-dependent HD superfamily phosphohydrolase